MVVEYFVGLDVGKLKGSACILHADGKLKERFGFKTDRAGIEDLAKRLPRKCKVAIEASTATFEIARLLQKAGHVVTVSNPRRTRAIASADVKNDQIDARTLAELHRCNYLPKVWVPPAEVQETRQLVSQRAHLHKQINMVKNRVHSILQRNLLPCSVKSPFSAKGRLWMRAQGLPVGEKFQLEVCFQLLDSFMAQKDVVTKRLAEEAARSQAVKLLMTIPGVGHIAAITLAAGVADIERFESPKKLAGYFGLYPTLYESGQRSRKGRVSKLGNRIVRTTLVCCANVAVRIDQNFRRFYQRICRKKGHKVAVVACARRLLVIMWHLLKRGTGYYFEQPRLSEGKIYRLNKALKLEPRKPATKVKAKPRVALGRSRAMAPS